MGYVLFWVLSAAVVGVAAASRGRSGFGWFLLSLAISPLLGLVLALVLPRRETAVADTRECPFCAETIKAKAAVCRYCQRELPPLEAVAVLPVKKGPPADLPDSALGRCPNCGSTVALTAAECWKCDAAFGPGSSWSVLARSAP
ncbi:MAG TPA: zinc ribbon domain-containing protein [Burkholderiaceae bacterium]|nr:zinc ribbon domain-containing protein [Burkholderiaceae bacterium]